MSVRRYLDRIKIDQIEDPSYSFLAKLQRQHLLTVPFENLDILQGKRIVLEEDHLYEKIVMGRRGGFCYELNGLFHWLLCLLHFSVSMVSGRVYLPTHDRFTPEFDHMVLLVHLEKTYVVDVGFGDSFRKPMAMPDGVVKDIVGRYRISPVQADRDGYLLEKQEKDEWRPKYSFTTYPRQMSDFAEMCVFHQTSPESHFTQRPVCTIATKRGRVTLSDHSLTITEGKAKRKMDVPSPENFNRSLREYFGITLKDS